MTTRFSIKLAFLAVVLASTAAFAQGAGDGTAGGGSATTTGARVGNPTGDAGSPGTGGVTGSGSSARTGSNTGNSSVDAQDRAVDTKIKSICKGC